jgi:hypothetical protein
MLLLMFDSNFIKNDFTYHRREWLYFLFSQEQLVVSREANRIIGPR